MSNLSSREIELIVLLAINFSLLLIYAALYKAWTRKLKKDFPKIWIHLGSPELYTQPRISTARERMQRNPLYLKTCDAKTIRLGKLLFFSKIVFFSVFIYTVVFEFLIKIFN